MKYSYLTIVLLFWLGPCLAQEQSPAPAAEPNPVLVKQLHWQLRDALRMQLPATWPEERHGQSYRKNYSIDYTWPEQGSSCLLELPEKKVDPETEQLTGGAKYLFSADDLALEGIRLIYTEDGKKMALLLPAREGRHFIYHPYDNNPDEQTDQIVIGWYDRVQEMTLKRLLGYFQAFFKEITASKQ